MAISDVFLGFLCPGALGKKHPQKTKQNKQVKGPGAAGWAGIQAGGE